MRLNSEFMGTVTVSPTKDVVAGEFSTWTFTFIAGQYGIDDGGSLRIAWRSVSDWDAPQFTEPAAPGYTTVKVVGKAQARISFAKFIRPFGNSILVDIHHGYLAQGDQVIITMGDRSGGSLGIRAQSFCEREHEFRVYLDPCGTYRYEEMPQRPVVRIVPAAPHELQAIVPGTVVCGEPFAITVRCLDEFGNPTGQYAGKVHLTIPQLHKYSLPAAVTLTSENGGALRLENCLVEEEGLWQVQVEDVTRGLRALSNASRAVCQPEYKLLWGDMHGQTGYTVGTGSLDDYYTFARDKAAVDFTGWQGNDFEISKTSWLDVRAQTKAYNAEGRFLVFLGYEWSGVTPQGGDHNVFFLGDNENFYPSSNWTAYQDTDPALNANPLPELWQRFAGRQDVLLIPHIGGRFANLDYFNPSFTSVIEIHSHHGTFEWFALEAMRRRLKVGFIAASDDHTCRPGLSYPLSGRGKSASGAFDVASGFTGVYAHSLTKKDVWEAIKARRCYASSFDRLLLDVRVDGHLMGQEYTTAGVPKLSVTAAANHPLEQITIFDWEQELTKVDLLPKHRSRIRIRWSGVVYRGRIKSAAWDGMLYVENGKLEQAQTYAFDRLDQGIKLQTDKYVQWTSSTSGDYDGLLLDITGDEKTVLHFNSRQGTVDIKLATVLSGPIVYPMGGENLQVEFDRANAPLTEAEALKACQTSYTCSLPESTGEHAFWVKVTQTNGNAAWSSPVFVTINKK